MASSCHVSLIACALTLMVMSVSPVAAEFISDLSTSPQDEAKALEVKKEQFWGPVYEAAERTKYFVEHQMLYAETQKVIDELPAENTYVREALSEALQLLQSADAMVLKEAVETSQLASEKLAAAATGSGSSFNFIHGGQDYFSKAIRHFVTGGDGRYGDRLRESVGERQADVLPMLRGTAAITGNVLQDCRLASKRSFDVLKYSIYNKGVPKTPEAAKAVANRLVDAVGQTRHEFMQGIIGSVNSITRDTEGKNDDPTVTVLHASLEGVDQDGSFAVATSLISEQVVNV